MNLRRKLAFFMALNRYVEIIVSGIPPLSLSKAKADSLTSVKAYGGLLQDSVPTPSDPVDLVCNNGALKILDKSDWTIFTNPTSIPGQGVFISADGKWYNADDRGAGCAIPLTIGKQYTLVIHKKTTALGTILRYGQSPQETPTYAGIQLTDWYRGEISDGQMVSFVAKQPYLVMQLSAVAVEAGMVQEAIEVLEAQGDNETLKLTPSNDTAGVANLFKIGNYVDTQEILTGLINHQLGIYVFDGTEDWTWSSGANAPARLNIPEVDYVLNTDVAPVMCSHFMPTYWNNLSPTTKTTPYVAINQTNQPAAKRIVFTAAWDANITDAESWKTFLATQYSAGTPVIVVYPLATEYEETAPVAQTMNVVAGDNTLSLTQQGMPNLEVEAIYTKAKY